MNSRSRIAVLVISYRNNRELITFLQHLNAYPPDQIAQVVAVANGLDEAGVRELKGATLELLRGRIKLLAGSRNPGYFGGAVLAKRELQSDPSVADWTIVTNDDIRFAPDFFSRLAECPPKGVGVIAPDIVVPATGLHQNPLYVDKPPKRRLRLLLWLHRHAFLMQIFVHFRKIRQVWRKRRSEGRPPASQAIYAPHGACVVFSSDYFARGGSLDYPCFLYGEEFFVAETARRLMLPVRVEPQLRVVHLEHRSTGLLAPSAMAGFVHESLSFLLAHYYRD